MFQYYCSHVPYAATVMHTRFEHFSDAFCYYIEVQLNSMRAITLVHLFESMDDLSSLQTGMLGSYLILCSFLLFLFYSAKSNLQLYTNKKESELNGYMRNLTTVKTFNWYEQII